MCLRVTRRDGQRLRKVGMAGPISPTAECYRNDMQIQLQTA